MKRNISSINKSQGQEQFITHQLSEERLQAWGHKIYQELDQEGLSEFEVRFLAECFIRQQQQHLPKNLLLYLQNNHNEFQRVTTCVAKIKQPTQKAPKYTIAAAFIIGLGLALSLIFLIPGKTNTQSQNEPHTKTVSDTLSGKATENMVPKKLPRKEITQEKAPAKKDTVSPQNKPKTATIKEQTPSIKKQSASDKDSLRYYIEIKNRFRDVGAPLEFDFKTRSRQRNQKDTIVSLFEVQRPTQVSQYATNQMIDFVLVSRVALTDTLVLSISIENGIRKPLQTIPLQRKDSLQWVGKWKAKKPGLYYWKFQHLPNAPRRATGKIYIGNQQLIQKLYEQFPELKGG